MEAHRLKEMPSDYDQIMFDELFKMTEGLRVKIAGEINGNPMGYDRDDILAELNVKFIHAFCRYYDEYFDDADMLLAHIINSLRNYKNKLIRRVYYSQPAEMNKAVIDIDGIDEPENIFVDVTEDPTDKLMIKAAMEYMYENLNHEAMLVFEIDTYPPEYIIEKLYATKHKNPNLNNIPAKYVAEYLGWDSDNGTSYVLKLRRQYKLVMEMAKEHFAS